MLPKKVTSILDQLAPVRTIQSRNRYAPWLSADTKISMKDRDSAQRKATQTQHPDDWRLYRNLRNTVTARMKLEKSSWQKQRLDHSQNSSTNLWKSIKTCLNWKSAGPPSQLFQDGVLINTPEGLATTMNRFFINKVERLRQSIPGSNIDPLSMLRETMSQRSCSFGFKAVHPDEVLKIIRNLKNSKATGIDEIDTYIIKLAANDLVPAITHIINLSLRDASFPTSWKKAKVVPLLKKGDALDPKNYRPVALLPILSKILERAVFHQLVEYLDENSLIHPNHHGSRKGHNTTTALIQMYDYWVKAVDNGEMAGAMMLDLSAAFDMVDHKILLEKLKLLGMESRTVMWMKSYLTGRSQSVCIDGCLSLALPIVCGVPQGSVLGPLLYILFTNDLPDIIHSNHEQLLSYKQPSTHCEPCGNLVNYVDDATYTFSHRDPHILSTMLSDKYMVIEQYMQSNRLVINSEKTHLVVMGTRRQKEARDTVQLKAGSHAINPTETETLLGCNINQNLKWQTHIQAGESSLTRQLTRRLNALQKVSVHSTFKTRLAAANGVFMSVLAYLIPLWGGCEDYLVRALQVLQNRAARQVTKLSWFTPTRQLLHQCGWLSIKQLIYYHSALTVFRITKSRSPFYLSQNLVTEHPYPTRLATGGGIRSEGIFGGPRSRSFLIRAPRDFNNIPADIRNCKTLPAFKQKLKNWVKTKIPVK